MQKLLAHFILFLVVALGPVAGYADLSAHCRALLRGKSPLLRPTRTLDSIRSLRFMSLNVKEHYVDDSYDPRFHQGHVQIKSERHVLEIARTIARYAPDIVTLQEVQNIDALKQINGHLKNSYFPIISQGNDRLNIAFLVRRNLPYYFSLDTYAHLPQRYSEMPLFNRDLPILTFRLAPDGPAIFALVGHHGKSMRHLPHDSYGTKLRMEQVHKAIDIVRQYLDFHGADLPVIFAGDLNTDIRSKELNILWTHFKDSFDVLPPQMRPHDRTTFVYMTKREREYRQIDAILVNQALENYVTNAFVGRYTNYRSGVELALPRTLEEKALFPSDHLPVIMDISTNPLAMRHFFPK